jgi:hypothetical protein
MVTLIEMKIIIRMSHALPLMEVWVSYRSGAMIMEQASQRMSDFMQCFEEQKGIYQKGK